MPGRKNLTEKERLQQENNLLKAKLIAERGALFPKEEAGKLTPEMENEWLHYIYNYEKMYENASQISIYEKIGKPAIKPSDALNDDEVSAELDNLLDLMDENGIDLTCLADYNDRVIYEFITKELLEQEIEDLKMEGLRTCFTYEEFHPNHDYDLRRQTEDFVMALLSRDWHDMDGTFIHDNLTDIEGRITSKEEFCRTIKLFQETYRSFDIKEKTITDCRFDVEKGEAFVAMNLVYDSITETGKKRSFAGTANLYFLLIYDYWNIHKAAIPGFNLPEK